jgi:DNA repair protein RecO (recombination protein O)
MKQLVTTGIILNRTDYGEADRIITLLTPNYGKLRLIAKGVRKVKSKLAGGIELFSVSNITYIQGRKDIGTLISARLVKHYGDIVKDLDRTMLGYELIKRLDRATEDEPEAAYFELLEQSFAALDDPAIDLDLIRLWFAMQLLRLGGHTPNLSTDVAGEKLRAEGVYQFSFDDMAFTLSAVGSSGDLVMESGAGLGQFTSMHIKFLRLGFGGYPPSALMRVKEVGAIVRSVTPLTQTVLQLYIR